MLRDEVRAIVSNALTGLGAGADFTFGLESSDDPAHGDYATNAALLLGKQSGRDPRAVAPELAERIGAAGPDLVSSAEAAGPGFVNIRIRNGALLDRISVALRAPDDWGKNSANAGKTFLVEYTDPNPFKQFHIGHLMSNAIGEAIARLHEASGANVLRLNYQGDVGMHVASSVWGMRKGVLPRPPDDAPLSEKADYLGKAYALGRSAYDDPAAKREIDLINKELYERKNPELNALYDLGRKWSLDYFETIYARLGTKFADYFFESEAGPAGLEIVRAHSDVFRESDGAVIFPGEAYGLHNRVFVNSLGLPTYEAKELGLNKMKFARYPDADFSLIVTANEVDAYFRVVLKAMEIVLPEVAAKTEHLSHGFLRLPSGKMSSRTGEVITAEGLISAVKTLVFKKLEERPELRDDARENIAEQVAIAAIKYSILRQGIGRDIVFDFDTSISFQGASGPYLQYTHARLKSILRKAHAADAANGAAPAEDSGELEHRLALAILQLPEITGDALAGRAPAILATYLLRIAHVANEFYHTHHLLSEENVNTFERRLALVRAAALTMKNGLRFLGIEAPEEM